GLARTVRAEEAGDPAGLDGEGDVVHGELVAVSLRQAVCLDHGCSRSLLVDRVPRYCGSPRCGTRCGWILCGRWRRPGGGVLILKAEGPAVEAARGGAGTPGAGRSLHR